MPFGVGFFFTAIGELLRELPKAKNQYDESLVDVPTKREAEKQANIDHHTSVDLQAMAANPDVVQAVLDKAEAEGRIISRKQVLDAIKRQKQAAYEAGQAYYFSHSCERSHIDRSNQGRWHK